MKRKKYLYLVSRVLLLALFVELFLMMGPIGKTDAGFLHQTNCRTIAEGKVETFAEAGTEGKKVGVRATAGVRIECDTEIHWNPFHSHDDEDDSSGSCDSSGFCDADWCHYCAEEHYECNFGYSLPGAD